MSQDSMNKNCHLVIMGRPNVGKSTLFNRLLGRKRALVHNQPGVTRDRLEEKTYWWISGSQFPVTLVDTGGLGGESFADEIFAQVQIALKTADVILFVFDSKVGLTPQDEELLKSMMKAGIHKRIPILGVVNKVDAECHEELVNEFYQAGLDSIYSLSAEHGRGIDDLKTAVADLMGFSPSPISEEQAEPSAEITELDNEENPSDVEGDEEIEEEEDSDESRESEIPKVAIIGRPNVGKSTLLNALLGQERMITSPIAGTTVDSIDSEVHLGGKPFLFIDTAGIRRKSKTEQGIEVLSIVQTKKALERANIAILVLDGETGITDQDEKIGGLIEEAGCSVILLVNKWDTQRRNVEFTSKVAAGQLRKEMGFLNYAPIVFGSALRNQGLDDLGDLIEEILHQRKLKIPTHEFTEWMRKEILRNNPANAKFYLCHQSGRHPPTFVCHVNDPEKVHFSLRRHLVNSLRERWGYMGTPVKMLFIEGKNRRSLPRKKKTPAHGVKVSR